MRVNYLPNRAVLLRDMDSFVHIKGNKFHYFFAIYTPVKFHPDCSEKVEDSSRAAAGCDCLATGKTADVKIQNTKNWKVSADLQKWMGVGSSIILSISLHGPQKLIQHSAAVEELSVSSPSLLCKVAYVENILLQQTVVSLGKLFHKL